MQRLWPPCLWAAAWALALGRPQACLLTARWHGTGGVTVGIRTGPATPEGVSVEAYCGSAGCPWAWATGAFDNSTGALTLLRNDGGRRRGQVAPDCSSIAFDEGGTWENLNLKVRTLHLVFMTHFDVGYTKASLDDVLTDYAENGFPQAFQTAKALRDRGGPEQFAWTSHPWLLLALLRNQTGKVSGSFLQDLRAAIGRDEIRWHANPMNMQSEAGERSNMEFGLTLSAELDEQFGKPKKIAASQKDEPGGTLGMVQMFAQAGVRLLHVGVNDFSTVPAMVGNSPGYHNFCNPVAWRDPAAAAELLVLHCSGYSQALVDGEPGPNMVAVLPGHDEALGFQMRIDNTGPPDVAQVLEGFASARRLFPNANVTLSTMDAWVEGVLRARDRLPPEALPVASGVEPGSTWIYGLASTPRKFRWYRAVARVAAQALRDGAVDPADPQFREFQRLLLKLPEHTAGQADGCPGNWSNEEFRDPAKPCHIGSPTYQTYVRSVLEHYDFVPRAVAALGSLQPLRDACNKALEDSAPRPPSLEGLGRFDWTSPATTVGGILVQFNGSGAIVALRRGAAPDHASPQRPLGLLQYATHSEAELADFGRGYCLRNCATDCGNCGFGKCNMSLAGAESAHYQPVVTEAWANTTEGRFVFYLTFPIETLHTKYGAPRYVTLEVRLAAGEGADAIAAELDLQWWAKPPTRLAESLWMTFSPQGPGPTGWEMDKLGRWVDPLAVPVNGSRTMHAVWSGIRHAGSGLLLETLDAPVVMPGDTLSPAGNFDPGDPGLPHPERGWSFNLFNNAWTTNYPIFSLDEADSFRWRLQLRAPAPPRPFAPLYA